MEPSGRSVRRVAVATRALAAFAAAALAVCVVGVGLVVHGVTQIDDASESAALRWENAELALLLSSLDSRMPELRRLVFSSEVAFDQIWVKSGLGIEPRSLGVGPFEADGQQDSTPAGSAHTSKIAALDFIALPLEHERLLAEGRRAQQGLGEMLEYFHDAERLLSNTPSIRPARTPWLTSGFGMRRDPMDGRWMMHKGIDFGGPIGTEIVAPADGVAIFVGTRGGYGKTVVLDHGYGLQTHYAHLSKQRVAVGDRVRRGDAIAEMGSTGKSTGPHLHYEVRRYGRPLDPARFVLD